MTRTYGLLLGAAYRAGLLALAVKAASVIVFANLAGAVVELRTFAAVIPFLAITAPSDVFLDIATNSTLAMATATTLYVAPAVLRADLPTPVTWGRLLGVVVATETVILQVVLHVLGAPAIRLERVWWIGLIVMAGLVLGAGGLDFDLRASRADPVEAEAPPTPIDPPAVAA